MQIFNFYGFLIQLLLKFLLFSLNFMKNSGKNRFLAPAPVPRLAPAGAGASAPAPVPVPVLGTSLVHICTLI